MEFLEILIILFGLICPWFIWKNIKGAVQDVRRIKRCTVETTAKILSWRIEEDSDHPTQCTPTIRYSFRDQVYETEFQQGTVTKYQKEHNYTSDTITIYADPDDPTSITPENKGHTIFRTVEVCVFVCGIFAFFFFLAILFLYLALR